MVRHCLRCFDVAGLSAGAGLPSVPRRQGTGRAFRAQGVESGAVVVGFRLHDGRRRGVRAAFRLAAQACEPRPRAGRLDRACGRRRGARA